ncbi:MAG: hypothetical protein KIT66_08905 [Chitinophagaceae bacterium]|nr:hypothetical protein [Chitinophagaceae bacterium]
MSALISVVKNAKWIDLSPKHKELREFLEQSISNPSKIIMIKGAFGIGKTNTLHYLFHYGWCELKTPVLYVSLEKLYPLIEKYAFDKPSKKIGNIELCEILDKMVKSVIQALKNNQPNNESSLFFFDWKEGSLEDFCNEFNPLALEFFSNDKLEAKTLNALSSEVIQTSIATNNRPLLLIDEFETKFSKLKNLIEASNGGELREFFDQVVEKNVSFNLMIGNGPASGYELKSENSKGSDDAESSRLIPKQVPFPLPENTKEFLGTSNKGLLNFAWWASRCRARHFLRLKEAVGNLESLSSKSSYSEFLSDFTFFNDPIESSEEGESPITYVKTEYFNDFSEELKDDFLPKLITEISPQKISFDKHSSAILKSKQYLYCSPSLINVSQKLMVALSSDVNEGMLKPYKEKGRYNELDYDLTIRKYFDFFLKSISNEEGNIAFGMADDNAADKSFSDMFILPLIHLTYDFLTQYEEESLPRNKQATEFLLNLLNDIKVKTEAQGIRSIFPKSYSLFKKNDYLDGEGFIQLSLNSIRETFEQPIGEPKLGYKNSQLEANCSKIQIDQPSPLIRYKRGDVELIFIPDLSQIQLAEYLKQLKSYFVENIQDPLIDNGKSIVAFIYLGDENETFTQFCNSLLLTDNNEDEPVALYQLNKFQCRILKSFSLNFPSHTNDFIDSLLKIGLVGISNGDLGYLKSNENIIELNSIVNSIKSPDWSERKETRRTIEHFEKLVFTNENSELKSICSQVGNDYENKLLELIPQKSNFTRAISKYIFSDEIYNDNIEYGGFTKKLINIFLFENCTVPNGFLELLKSANDFNLGGRISEKEQKLSFYEFKTFIQTKGDIIRKHSEMFSKDDSVIQNLSSLVKILLKKPLPKKIAEFKGYLAYTDEHFIVSYHKALGDILGVSLTEAIYNLEYGSNISIEDEKVELIKEIEIIKVNINNVRSEINQSNSRLQELLKLDELPFSYENKLGEFLTKIVIACQKQLEDTYSISILLTTYEILSYSGRILNDASVFSRQLKQIVTSIENKYKKISTVQGIVNEIYSDTFYANILNNAKGLKNQTGEYFWSSIMLPTIKAIPKYAYIFKKKDEYLPSEKRILDNSNSEKFLKDLDSKFEEKWKKIEADKSILDSHVKEIKKVIEMETNLRELLKITNNA